MLIPVIPLPEKSQKECSLSKQLIQDLDYSIPLILHSHSHVKLSCLKSGKGRFTRSIFSIQLFFWHCLSS